MTTDWFPLWLERHLERHALEGLPDPNKMPLFYEAWRDEFEARRVKHEHAEVASKLLASKKHYKSAHLAELLRLVAEVRRTSGDSPAELAESASADCRTCGGEGVTSRRCTIVGLRRDRDEMGSFAVFCVCPLGRWKLGKAQREAKANQRVLDLAAIRQGEVYRAVIHGKTVTLEFEDDEGETARTQARAEQWA